MCGMLIHDKQLVLKGDQPVRVKNLPQDLIGFPGLHIHKVFLE